MSTTCNIIAKPELAATNNVKSNNQIIIIITKQMSD